MPMAAQAARWILQQAHMMPSVAHSPECQEWEIKDCNNVVCSGIGSSQGSCRGVNKDY